ncbi:MAG TPA: type II secretion system protein [Gemmataceae bacterium]|nr:type II secretion system protein [Gemmataceae bacterium]
MILPLATRRGYSLLEMLCVMVLLAIVGGGLTLLLMESLAVQRAQNESYDRLVQHHALADVFRADVASAEKAPEEWQQYTATSETLILQLKNGAHVVYIWCGEELERRVCDGEEESSRMLPVGEGVGVEFTRDGSGRELVRLRLLTLRSGNPLPGQTLEIAAAVEGDWR